MMSKVLILIVLSAYCNFGFGKPDQVYSSGGEQFKFEILSEQDGVVWGFDFLDAERIIFSERDGKLKIYNLKNKLVTAISGVPKVHASGQGGLLDVRVHPTQKSKIYFTYSEPSEKGSTTALARATLSGDRLTDVKKLFSANEPSDGKIHYGSRIEFDGRGHIYITVGDRNERDRVQDLAFHNGKIVRLKEDGSVPQDNPFVATKNAKPEIWSLGHRSPQGLVLNQITGDLWMTEMGPRGGDELNIVKKGLNYGWPIVTYGREYYGPKIGEGKSKPGIEEPVAHWVPSISPSAVTFYTGKVFKKWQSQIFIGTLSGSHLRRLKLDGTRVVEQETLLENLNLRFRNVRTGPEGFLYLSTDDGKIARLVNL